MTQSPYLLRWLAGQRNIYYCHEVLRIREEHAAQVAHRRQLAASRFPAGRLRVVEDKLVRGRLLAADAANTAAAETIAVNSNYTRERVWAAYARDAATCYPGVDPDQFRPDPTLSRRREVLSIGTPLLLKGTGLAYGLYANPMLRPRSIPQPQQSRSRWPYHPPRYPLLLAVR